MRIKINQILMLVVLAVLTCVHSAEMVVAQYTIAPRLSTVSAFGPPPFTSVQVPAEMVGAWQVQIEGRAFKLKTNYNVEIKITDGQSSLPTAIVSYFAGDARRPSTICRSQLTLVSAEGQSFVFEESLNYKGGKDSCPIWDQLAIEIRSGSLWFQWRDAGRRKATIKMEAGAFRPTGGKECRLVSGDGGAGGQEWCRDVEGNWSPSRR